MGEYARQYTLDRFGVDIGDDREPVKTKPVKRYGCSCGRMFITQQAKEQHQKDTGHINKGGPQANRVYSFVTAVLAKWGQHGTE